ncbi:hypothetical protein CW702_00730 [Candidatus Bathyarchaeota archaeon]|nr:MAG: hypothetical protein CW702_00730 [Candidatus Bathyarchaeota archaeon]
MKFPSRVYTEEEVELARTLIRRGYRHRIRIIGSQDFRSKVRAALSLIKKAGKYDFLRSYIRSIVEINGLSQLREADASIWLNKYAVEDPYEAASFIMQKAWQMSIYLQGIRHYGHIGETAAIKERIRFLKELRDRCRDPKIRSECDKILSLWQESVFL